MCYIIVAVGVSKILTFYSLDFSLLVNLPQSVIYKGLTLGTWGSMLGKFICGYFILKFNYRKVLTISFLLMSVCLVLEFMHVVAIGLYSFYVLRFFQGFLSGIIYSGILANLGDFYFDEQYEKLITVLTGGIGLAGPLFGLLYVVFPFRTIINCLFFVPLIATIACQYVVKNKDALLLIHEKKERKSFMYYINIIRKEKYICLFALSFSFSLICSLLTLANLNRLFILYLLEKNITLKPIIVRFCGMLPLLFGSLGYFIKKKYGNYMGVLLIMTTTYTVNLFFKSIYMYFFLFILSYGLHLILIPHASSLVLTTVLESKDYYSYIIHAIRSLFFSILVWMFFGNLYFVSFKGFSSFCVFLQLMAAGFYFIGKYFLEKNKC
jgi:MFS family permease